MARRRKPLKIDNIYHESSGITVPVYLTTAGYGFEATLPDGKRVVNQIRNELDIEIQTWLNENTVLEWIPLIQADEMGMDYGDNSRVIGLDISRMYYAKKRSGTGLMYKHWEPTENGNEPAWEAKWGFAAEDFNPPVSSPHGSRDLTTFYLPYSDDLWTTLQGLDKFLGWFKLNLREALSGGDTEALAQLCRDMVKVAPVPLEKPSKFEI